MQTIILMRVTYSKEVPGLGQKIRQYRLLSTKSLTELAASAGISTPHWNRIENEKLRDVPYETLKRVEQALAVDLGIDI